MTVTTTTDTDTHTPKLDPAGLKLSHHTATITKAKHERQFDFTLSSEEPDRGNDIVTQLGIDLKAFRANPVVLVPHNAGFDTPPPPVGRVPRLWITPTSALDSLHGTVEFPDPGVHALADTLHGLVSTGFLNAVSIGFRPIETSFDEERNGFNFLRTELVELSLVPVPMNASALIEMAASIKNRDVDVASLTEWVEQAQKMLDAVATQGTTQPVPVAAPTPALTPDLVPDPVPDPVSMASIEAMIKEAVSSRPEYNIPDGYELKKVGAVTHIAPIPTPTVTAIPTSIRPTTGQQSAYLKGVIRAALAKSATEELSYHTGRLTD